MSTHLWAGFLLAGQVFFSGVRSRVEMKAPKRPERPKNCAVEFFEGQAPARGHEVLATIHVYVQRNKITRGRRAVYEEAEPEFQKRACKLGADALVVLQQTVSHAVEVKLLYVKADAIRFTDSAGPK